MNKQEMFNAAYIGIIKQGGPSMVGSRCAYRGDNGRKCAAGWIITDEEYSAMGDELNCVGIFSVDSVRAPKSIAGELEFVAQLQRAHDQIAGSGDYFTNWFKESMQELALKHNLTIPEIPSDDLSQTNS